MIKLIFHEIFDQSSFIGEVIRDQTKFASKLPEGSLMICTKRLRLCQHLLILLLRIFSGNSNVLEIHDLPRFQKNSDNSHLIF